MKRILNLKPILPKQMVIWNPDRVLKYIEQLDDEISLQLISRKLAILLFTLPEQKDQTLRLVNIEQKWAKQKIWG